MSKLRTVHGKEIYRLTFMEKIRIRTHKNPGAHHYVPPVIILLLHSDMLPKDNKL